MRSLTGGSPADADALPMGRPIDERSRNTSHITKSYRGKQQRNKEHLSLSRPPPIINIRTYTQKWASPHIHTHEFGTLPVLIIMYVFCACVYTHTYNLQCVHRSIEAHAHRCKKHESTSTRIHKHAFGPARTPSDGVAGRS